LIRGRKREGDMCSSRLNKDVEGAIEIQKKVP